MKKYSTANTRLINGTLILICILAALTSFRLGSRVIPVVRSRKEPLNLEVLRETLTKIIESLHVTVRPVYLPVTMAEVNIRHDKYTVVIQELRYFGEFLGLKVPHILKKTLGNNDVEALVIEPNWRLKEVSFNQIRRRVMYGYIDTIVLDIWPKERHQGCGPAANIEKRASFTSRQPVYNSCGLFEAIVRSTVL